MTSHDSLVISGDVGKKPATAVARRGLDVEFVKKDPFSRAYLTRGRDPLGRLLHRTDTINQIRPSEVFEIGTDVSPVDPACNINGRNSPWQENGQHTAQNLRGLNDLTLSKMEGQFVGNQTPEIDDTRGTTEKVVGTVAAYPMSPSSIDKAAEVRVRKCPT